MLLSHHPIALFLRASSTAPFHSLISLVAESKLFPCVTRILRLYIYAQSVGNVFNLFRFIQFFRASSTAPFHSLVPLVTESKMFPDVASVFRFRIHTQRVALVNSHRHKSKHNEKLHLDSIIANLVRK